ncbi:MarR family winged helix-turn-helix transcriptional regulator [Antrihabitans cavernicola]|uniref:Winged helix-turn-helix transcriptional regulator n=1 Tax=Antrihabitans cavernicola TaxID=2495913 RepID=A0A5A7S5I4_9NOCA|nr:MarR family winged helix-turn-helix transcriptional regulator [Spelaeibacter cavernicola]KAA0017034.1 winged helix-turn-helix transcriptional regulator [Spelaeibacter cavernicola]
MSTSRAGRHSTASRKDVAAMLVPLAQAFTTAELPILRAHNLTMWAYIVLIALTDSSVRSQTRLANEIGADKTRLISVLDDLQGRGLIERYPDSADRRVHLLSVTAAGEGLCRAVQTEIQRREELTLSRLEPRDRAGFLRALGVLSSLPVEEIAGEQTSV